MPATTRFEGKTVLITGGSSGIGLAAAQRLAAEGAKLALLARDEARLVQAVASLPGAGHAHRVCDAADEDATAVAVKSLREQLGPIHAGVLCAGAHTVRPLAVSKAKTFEDMYRLNVLTAVSAIRALVKAMPPEGGSLTVLSSVAGLRGSPAASAYAGAKAALLAIVHSLAVELAPRKIRINAVVPGVVATPMTEQFLGTLPPAQKDAIVAGHPLGLGRPEDVAAAIAFLASDDARWITGSELVIDGGLSSR